MKRIFCALIAAVICLSGCGSGDTPQTEEQKIHISMSFWEPGAKNELKSAFTQIAEDYASVRPDVEIELLVQPVQKYNDWLTERCAESDMPTIIYNEKANLIKMDRARLIYRLDDALRTADRFQNNEIWADTFDEDKLRYTVDINGKTGLAIPLSALGLAVYYNMDIYRANGLKTPQTWSEFLKNCEVIEQSGVNPISFMAQKGDAVNWLQWVLCTNAFGRKFLGDKAINTDGDNVISQEEMAYAVDSGAYDVTKEPYKSIYRQYLIMVGQYAKYAHNAEGLDEDGAKEQFINGRSAHLFTGSWELKNILKNPDIGFEVGVMPFPVFTSEDSAYGGERMTIRTASCLAVTKMKNSDGTTPEQEAAVDFLKFLTSVEEYRKYAGNTGTVSTVKGVGQREELDAFAGTIPSIEMFSMGRSEWAYNVTLRAIAGYIDVDDPGVYELAQKSNREFAHNYISVRR